jgi:hypothetical protein
MNPLSPVKILVCGSRRWTDADIIRRHMIAAAAKHHLLHPIVIIHGAAPGADTVADDLALELGWRVVRKPADWARHRWSAGPIRNREMLDLKPDLVLAFATPSLALSRGTRDCVEEAQRRGIPVRVIEASGGS